MGESTSIYCEARPMSTAKSTPAASLPPVRRGAFNSAKGHPPLQTAAGPPAGMTIITRNRQSVKGSCPRKGAHGRKAQVARGQDAPPKAVPGGALPEAMPAPPVCPPGTDGRHAKIAPTPQGKRRFLHACRLAGVYTCGSASFSHHRVLNAADGPARHDHLVLGRAHGKRHSVVLEGDDGAVDAAQWCKCGRPA